MEDDMSESVIYNPALYIAAVIILAFFFQRYTNRQAYTQGAD